MTKILVFCLLTVALMLATGADVQADPGGILSPTIRLEKRWDGIIGPVAIAHPDDDSDRLFVVERWGRIRVIEHDKLLDAPFLDIKDRVTIDDWEQGLLGLAFPPGYAGKQYFYVNYIDRHGDTVIARYHADPARPNSARPNSEEIILRIAQPGPNHNGGSLAFGPHDGYLYISSGEGQLSVAPLNNAQDPASLLGKILRIDVEGPTKPYGIPADNPFVNTANARGEVWALGLRNPWRFSFDPQTGDLFIGDVGQFAWEEIDFQPANSAGGENYGWPVLEGNHCYYSGACTTTGMTPPIFEYPHQERQCAVIGGEVYRGAKYADLFGLYLFGDMCRGRIWASQQIDSAWHTKLLTGSDLMISAFGRNAAGDLFVSHLSGGAIYEIVSTPTLYLPLLIRPA